MTKLFALISVLLFVFKALAVETTSVESDTAAKATLLGQYSDYCENKKAKAGPPAKTDEWCQLQYNLIYGPSENECTAANEKFDTRYREFLKTKKEDTREARKESSEAEKAAQEAHATCQEKVQDIQEEINKANEDLQTKLSELEEQISEETSNLNESLKASVEKAKELSDQISQVVGSESISIETNYSANMRKLLSECQKSINESLAQARKYMDERRKARNAGILKYSSTTTSFNKNKDQQEAQKMIDQTKEICKAEETNLKETKELQIKMLQEKLQSLKNTEALLQVELNKINQDLQALPNKKLQKQNDLTKTAFETVQAATLRLQQQKQICQASLTSAQKEAKDLVNLAQSEQEDPSTVMSLFDAAQSTCCTSNNKNYPLLCGEGGSSKEKARKKIKKSLGGPPSARGTK